MERTFLTESRFSLNFGTSRYNENAKKIMHVNDVKNIYFA